jgi:hypothetical protein
MRSLYSVGGRRMTCDYGASPAICWQVNPKGEETKRVPVLRCPIQFAHGLAQNQAQASAVIASYRVDFQTRSQNCEKRLLASSYLSVCLSVHPSVRMEQFGFHWTDFHEISYLRIFRKYAEKIQVPLKSDNNNGYFTWRPMYIYDNISLNSS